MTLGEFKAWFGGFTEAWSKPPSAKQWARIKKRVAEIDGTITTYPVYVDRYRHYPMPWYQLFGTAGASSSVALGSIQSVASDIVQMNAQNMAQMEFTPTDGMYALGKADAAEIN